MHVEIKSQGFEMTQALRNYTLQRLQSSMGLVRDRARHISVHLSDENGPRGGVDKRCMVAIRIAGGAPVVVEDTRTDMYSAIDRVAKRALNSLVRRLSRNRNRRGRGARHSILDTSDSSAEAA
jgi:putative sigma-54 modulation protein